MGGAGRGEASLQAQLRQVEGPRSTLDARAWPAPPPQCSQGGAAMCGGSLGEGPQEGAPLHSTFGPPGAASTRGQEVIIQQGRHPRDPAPGRRGPQDSRAHTGAHTRSCLSIRPSGPGLRPRPGGPCGRRRHGELGSALTLVGARPAGRWPFTSEGPRCQEGPEAAGHGQTQSRPPKSWSWGCPGRPASTARRAPTGLGIHRWT